MALILVVAICIAPLLSFGQSVTNQVATVQVDQKDEKSFYKITYDLVAPFDNIPCVVKVKLIKRAGNSSFLTSVTGDVGYLVFPGKGKTIFWDYGDELIHFSGEINLSIEAEPAVNISGKIKRNKQFKIQLAPIYEAKKNYAVKLFRNGQEVNRLQDILLVENSFSSTIPPKTKLGKNYQLAITNGDQTYFSNAFKLKPRVNRALIVIPLVTVPVYLVYKSNGEANEALPGPPSGN